MCALLLLGASPSTLPDTSAQCAVLMHEDGRIIYSKNADKISLIASTTKLMTALVCAENCKLDEIYTVKAENCAVEGSSMYLRVGEEYTVHELLTGLILASGNDAALAIAEHTAGSIEAFVELMNIRAKELGLNNTSFVNPHGLNAPEHYSTAEDMAKLMLECMDNEIVSEISAMKSATVKGCTYINHNKLLRIYNACIGGKTGYTEKAGRCLVSCAQRNGERYVCVTLSAPDDWNDHVKLYEYAFSNYSVRNVTEGLSFDVQVISGERDNAVLRCEESKVFMADDESAEVIVSIPQFVFAPVQSGDKCGTYVVMLNGEKLAEGELYFESDIKQKDNLRSIL